MLSLHQITETFEQLIHAYENADDEVEREAVFVQIEKYEGLRDEKVENCCAVVKNFDIEIQALDTEIKRLRAKKDSLQQKSEKFYNYLTNFLPKTNWSSRLHSIRWRVSKATDIRQEELIPDQYLRRKVIIEPNKVDILKDLKAGAVIPGCALKENVNLIIS